MLSLLKPAWCGIETFCLQSNFLTTKQRCKYKTYAFGLSPRLGVATTKHLPHVELACDSWCSPVYKELSCTHLKSLSAGVFKLGHWGPQPFSSPTHWWIPGENQLALVDQDWRPLSCPHSLLGTIVENQETKSETDTCIQPSRQFMSS